MNIKRVLITGGRAPVALELARLFQKEGILVQMAESFPYALSKSSKKIEKWHVVAPPKQAFSQFIADLTRIVIDEKMDLLLPTCEEVFYIAKGREKLSPYTTVFADEPGKLRILHDKAAFVELLSKLQLPHPHSIKVTSTADWNDIVSSFSDDDRFVAKPVFSRFASHVQIGTKNDLLPGIQPTKDYPWLVQEYLEGQQVCTFSIARNGRLTAHVAYPTKFTAGKGATIAFQNVQEPDAKRIVEKIVASLDFTGMISFDFIKTARGPIPIECNPRATSGLHLFMNEPISRAFAGGQSDICLEPAGVNQRMLGLAMLLYGLPSMRSLSELTSWFSTFRQSSDVIWQSGDSAPFVYQFFSYWKMIMLARKQNISPLEASTWDIEWNGGEESE